MTTQTWQHARERAIQLFGDTPGAQLEQRILDVYQRHPNAIADAITRIGAAVAQGKVRKGWPVLDTEAARLTIPFHDVTPDERDERENAARKAETWIRNAGFHIDAQHELEDALFGDFGQLKTYANDYELRHRMTKLWRTLRPTGEQLEKAAQAAATKWKADRAKAAAAKALKRKTDLAA